MNMCHDQWIYKRYHLLILRCCFDSRQTICANARRQNIDIRFLIHKLIWYQKMFIICIYLFESSSSLFLYHSTCLNEYRFEMSNHQFFFVWSNYSSKHFRVRILKSMTKFCLFLDYVNSLFIIKNVENILCLPLINFNQNCMMF